MKLKILSSILLSLTLLTSNAFAKATNSSDNCLDMMTLIGVNFKEEMNSGIQPDPEKMISALDAGGYSILELVSCAKTTTKDQSKAIEKRVESREYSHFLIENLLSKKTSNTDFPKITIASCVSMNIELINKALSKYGRIQPTEIQMLELVSSNGYSMTEMLRCNKLGEEHPFEYADGIAKGMGLI
jgi:hypothetical protein